MHLQIVLFCNNFGLSNIFFVTFPGAMKYSNSCRLPYLPVTSHIWRCLSLTTFFSHSIHLAETLPIPSICHFSMSLSLSCQLPDFLILTRVRWTSLTFWPLQIFSWISSFSSEQPYYHPTFQWFAEHILSSPNTSHISLLLAIFRLISLFLLHTIFSWTYIFPCHFLYFPATYNILP